MYENRTTYPKTKTQMYAQLQDLPKKYKVMALVKMEKDSRFTVVWLHSEHP